MASAKYRSLHWHERRAAIPASELMKEHGHHPAFNVRRSNGADAQFSKDSWVARFRKNAVSGHTKIENTVRYLGVDVEDALELAEHTEV